jgi:peptidoglycan/xylan/chitin deacetylase (PgdA/CDA1 family)
MVHGVMDIEVPSQWTPLRPQLSRKQLERALSVLSRHYRFVSFQDAVDMLSGAKPILPYSIVVTFDDGYRNTLIHAMPILRKFHVPATIFVATGHIDQRKPYWFDRLDYALQHAEMQGRSVKIGPETIVFGNASREDMQHRYKEMRDAAKTVLYDDREMLEGLIKITEGLETESSMALDDFFETDDWSSLLTWDEIRTASEEGVSFGSHTVDHVRLSRVDLETAHGQLVRSQRMIEDVTGQPCRFLCYPNGDVSDDIVRLSHDCGYQSAVTTQRGTNRVGDDLMLLRRFPLPLNGSAGELLMLASGLSHLLDQWKSVIAGLLPFKIHSKRRTKNVPSWTAINE